MPLQRSPIKLMARPLIIFVLPDLGGGGAQKVMLQIAGGLCSSDFDIRLLVLGGSQAFAAHVPGHIIVEQGGAGRMREGLIWATKRIKALAPDVCISVMGYLNLALLGLKPILSGKTRFIVREANALAPTLAALPTLVPGRRLYASLYPQADIIVTPTGEIAAELAALSPRIAPRLRIVPNPVDVSALRKAALPWQRQPGDGLRFVSAGRLTSQKGYDRLVDVLPALPHESHVMVFGEGPDREALVRQSERNGTASRITFSGFTHELPSWIAGADAFLLPSRWEGLPNVVLESLAIGTPAVVTDEVAVNELTRLCGKNALRAEPMGLRFAEAATEVAKSDRAPGLRASLLPAEYRFEHVIGAWNAMLSDLLDGPVRTGDSAERTGS